VAGTFKVLSIDGGGIRGIIPAMLLAEIEHHSGKSIAEMFDLIAGTSTGGILALGLTKPGLDGGPEYSAKKLIDLYENEGEQIFSLPAWDQGTPVGGLAEEKYPSEGIEEVAKMYFQEVWLAEALTRVFVTSYDIEERIPWFFRSDRAEGEPDYNFLMREVARATCATPTYFKPLQLRWGPHGEGGAFIDGGVFANNPAMCAYVEARKILDEQGRSSPEETDFLVVSLGTGELIRSLPYEEVQSWGLLAWARPVIDVAFDGVSATVDFQLEELLSRKDGVRRYYRFQTELVDVNDAIYDVSPENVQGLKRLARAIIDNEADRLSELYEWLKPDT
jgi:uncharacterized protein